MGKVPLYRDRRGSERGSERGSDRDRGSERDRDRVSLGTARP